MPVLSNSYRLQHHGPNAAYLKVVRRPTPLKPESLPAAALREVALSLQIYQQGRALLQQAVIINRPAAHPRPDYLTNRP